MFHMCSLDTVPPLNLNVVEVGRLVLISLLGQGGTTVAFYQLFARCLLLYKFFCE